MYPRLLILLSPLRVIVMSETNSAAEAQVSDVYLPAMTARPTFGRLESFLKQHLGRYGIVPVPYDAIKK